MNLRFDLFFFIGGFFLVCKSCTVPFGFCLTLQNYEVFLLWAIRLTLWFVFTICLAVIWVDFTTCSADSQHSLHRFTVTLCSIWRHRSRLVLPVQFTSREAFARYVDVHWSSCKLAAPFPSGHGFPRGRGGCFGPRGVEGLILSYKFGSEKTLP